MGLGNAHGCLQRDANLPQGVNHPPCRPAGILPTIAVAWSLLYYRYRWVGLRAEALRALPLQFSSPPPHHRWHRPCSRRCKPSPVNMPAACRLPSVHHPRWAHRVALRYRASLQTKQKVVHKFFDELEVEVSGRG